MSTKQLRGIRRAATVLVLAGTELLAGFHSAVAQVYSRLDLGWSIEVGGEAERYARVLQLAGAVPLTPWSIQPFSPSQVRAMRPRQGHPWAGQFADSLRTDSGSLRVLRPMARLIGNSTYAYQVSGGPTWAGRGLTADVQGGVAWAWKSVYAEAAPVAFVAQNAEFPLAPNGLSGNGQYADARFPSKIDAPQRFGAGAYSGVGAGTSSLVCGLAQPGSGRVVCPSTVGAAAGLPAGARTERRRVSGSLFRQ